MLVWPMSSPKMTRMLGCRPAVGACCGVCGCCCCASAEPAAPTDAATREAPASKSLRRSVRGCDADACSSQEFLLMTLPLMTLLSRTRVRRANGRRLARSQDDREMAVSRRRHRTDSSSSVRRFRPSRDYESRRAGLYWTVVQHRKLIGRTRTALLGVGG